MTQQTKKPSSFPSPVNRRSRPSATRTSRPVLECIATSASTFGGLKAVDNFNVTIGRTEITGLIGPNGAGKTTVFNLLTKVYQPTHGTIHLRRQGHRMTSTPRRSTALGIARTFQNIRLFGEHDAWKKTSRVGDGHADALHACPRAFSACPRFWKEEQHHARARDGAAVHLPHGGPCQAPRRARLPYGAQRRLEIRPCAGHEPESAAS